MVTIINSPTDYEVQSVILDLFWPGKWNQWTFILNCGLCMEKTLRAILQLQKGPSWFFEQQTIFLTKCIVDDRLSVIINELVKRINCKVRKIWSLIIIDIQVSRRKIHTLQFLIPAENVVNFWFSVTVDVYNKIIVNQGQSVIIWKMFLLQSNSFAQELGCLIE